jgi:hypothetical protein
LSTATATLPGAAFACCAERNAANKNKGMYHTERTRNRVAAMSGMRCLWLRPNVKAARRDAAGVRSERALGWAISGSSDVLWIFML